MPFFESLLILLLAAIALLRISRRFSLPYPAMLAAAGVALAMVPGVRAFPIDPKLALALFITPALVDAAFDFPVATARRFWGPLVALAVGSVVVTAALVAWAGWMFIGLPIAAALVLGAIVAPPDAAAATAVLSSMAIPRSTDAVLRGESLFNDAAALLLFSGALAVQSAGTLDMHVGVQLAVAAPGGILLGIVAAKLVARLERFFRDTLGGNLLQFVNAFLLWIVADRLGLSAVLCIVAFAMTLALDVRIGTSPRMRVHSYAVWSTVVFVLNVLAFLLMGMQARTIVSGMSAAHLRDALLFAILIVLLVIAARFAIVLAYNRLTAWWSRYRGLPQPSTLRQGVLASWCGMRGLVTLATAFALPADFPQRDVVVLAAFAVVIGTLVVQGLTLAALIRLLGLDRSAGEADEMAALRSELARAALETLKGREDPAAAQLRAEYQTKLDARNDPASATALEQRRALGLAAVVAQRKALDQLQADNRLNADEYNLLLEELDWRELTLLPAEKRRVEEQ
jgi:CPA1 family monovalent cation:H+ antiporter